MANSDERFSDKVLDDEVLDGGALEDNVLEGSALEDNVLEGRAAGGGDLDETSHAEPLTETEEIAAAGHPYNDPATLREIFAAGSRDEQAEALGRLLSFAPWDEIWSHVDRSQARNLFPDVELPESLRAAWARYLGLPDHDA